MRGKIYSLFLLTVKGLVFVLFGSENFSKNPEPLNPAYTLWYDKQTKVWQEIIPVGNDRLGAMIFGRANKERLQLNDITFWFGMASLCQFGNRLCYDKRQMVFKILIYV